MIPGKTYLSKQNRSSIYIAAFYLFVAVFAPLLANEKPLFISINGKIFFPAFSNSPYSFIPDSNNITTKILSNSIDWKNLHADIKIFPPIAWSPMKSDLSNSFASPFDEQFFSTNGTKRTFPFQYRHFLGTGKTGNDLFSGIIHGCRTSLIIGILSTTIALLLGIFLGSIAGYFGDDKFKINRGSLFLCAILLIPAWFYSFYLRAENIQENFSNSIIWGYLQIILSVMIFACILAAPLFLRFPSSSYLGKKIDFPIDTFISRIIEIFLSLPRLILILVIAAISQPSVVSIIFIIGLTSWTETARIVRAQFLSMREMNYVSSAKAVGNTPLRILFVHMLPNIFSQIIILGIYGIASAILTETGLSFLGAGVPADTATWGSLMYQARENYQAWWLVIFSGAAIFFLLLSLFKIGKHLKESSKRERVFNKI